MGVMTLRVRFKSDQKMSDMVTLRDDSSPLDKPQKNDSQVIRTETEEDSKQQI